MRMATLGAAIRALASGGSTASPLADGLTPIESKTSSSKRNRRGYGPATRDWRGSSAALSVGSGSTAAMGASARRLGATGGKAGATVCLASGASTLAGETGGCSFPRLSVQPSTIRAMTTPAGSNQRNNGTKGEEASFAAACVGASKGRGANDTPSTGKGDFGAETIGVTSAASRAADGCEDGATEIGAAFDPGGSGRYRGERIAIGLRLEFRLSAQHPSQLCRLDLLAHEVRFQYAQSDRRGNSGKISDSPAGVGVCAVTT